MKRLLRMLLILPLISTLTFGFRTFPGVNGWSISVADPTLWIRSCRSLTFASANFPAGDPLDPNVTGSVPTYTAALNSVLNDFNSVPGSFLRLALYPADPNNPGAPATEDSPFTPLAAETRTIDLCFADQTFTAGHAKPKWNGDGKVIGCKIELNTKEVSAAEDFVAVLTHEIGHCLGFDHPQETDDSIMSYFSDAIRLQSDDKMGLTFLYPQEAAFGRERPSLGLSCSPTQ